MNKLLKSLLVFLCIFFLIFCEKKSSKVIKKKKVVKEIDPWKLQNNRLKNAIKAQIQVKEVKKWRDSFIQKKISLNDDEIVKLFESAFLLKEKKIEISKKYFKILSLIKKKKQTLKKRFLRTKRKNRKKILKLAESYLRVSLEKILIPLWLGTPYDVNNGRTKDKPDFNKTIHCSFFLQKILEDAGFHSFKYLKTWLATLGPKSMVYTFKKSEPVNLKNYENLIKKMNQDGPGMYLLGIKGYYGHVLFARYYGNDRLIILHSGPTPGGAHTTIEDGKYHLKVFNPWKEIYTIKLSGNIVKSWLFSEPIVPKWFVK